MEHRRQILPPGFLIPVRILRIATLATAAVILGLLYFPTEGGQPLLSLSGMWGKARALVESRGDETTASAGNIRTLYKWRGKDGVWEYSNVRPPDQPGVQEVRVPVNWVEGSDPVSSAGAEGRSPRARSASEVLEASRAAKGVSKNKNAELERLMNEVAGSNRP